MLLSACLVRQLHILPECEILLRAGLGQWLIQDFKSPLKVAALTMIYLILIFLLLLPLIVINMHLHVTIIFRRLVSLIFHNLKLKFLLLDFLLAQHFFLEYFEILGYVLFEKWLFLIIDAIYITLYRVKTDIVVAKTRNGTQILDIHKTMFLILKVSFLPWHFPIIIVHNPHWWSFLHNKYRQGRELMLYKLILAIFLPKKGQSGIIRMCLLLSKTMPVDPVLFIYVPFLGSDKRINTLIDANAVLISWIITRLIYFKGHFSLDGIVHFTSI